MKEPRNNPRLTTALIAYGQRTHLRPKDLEQVLVELVDVLPDPEAAQANDALFHLRKFNEAVLVLDNALLGEAGEKGQPGRDGK